MSKSKKSPVRRHPRSTRPMPAGPRGCGECQAPPYGGHASWCAKMDH